MRYSQCKNLIFVLLLLSFKPDTVITRLFKSAMSRQVKQKKMEPEDLGKTESWYNKTTEIVLYEGGTCSAKTKRENGRVRDMAIYIIT